MHSIIKKSVLAGMLLFLSACAHYQQPIYNRYAGPYPAYGNGYVIREKNYYYDDFRNSHGGYSGYRDDADEDRHHHEHPHHDHKDRHYRGRPAWNKGELKPYFPKGPHHHPQGRKDEPVLYYGLPDRKGHGRHDGNGRRDNLYLVERKNNKDKPDRSSENHHKHEQHHKHQDRKR